MFSTINELLILLISLKISLSKLPSTNEKPKVYFTKEISPKAIVKLYEKLGVKLEGKLALKVHSGEYNGKYFLHPEFLQPIHDKTNGTFVECNAAYAWPPYGRDTTANHMRTAQVNGWTKYRFQVLDEDPEKDEEIEINENLMIRKNYVGQHFKEYDSCLVLSHFKGHGMGGFGGAMKQLSIGFASRKGKAYIHSAGKTMDPAQMLVNNTQIEFIESMADAAASVVKAFRQKKGIAFINVIVNVSESCDCGGGERQKEPKVSNIGIAASTDPIAIDQACLNLIQERGKNIKANGTQDFKAQVNRQYGANIFDFAEAMKIGSKNYSLVEVNTCEKGSYVKDGNKCEGCGINNCEECDYMGKCQVCNSGYYLNGDKVCKSKAVKYLLVIGLPCLGVIIIVIVVVIIIRKRKKGDSISSDSSLGQMTDGQITDGQITDGQMTDGQ